MDSDRSARASTAHAPHPQPSFLDVLVAPWRHLFRPDRAAGVVVFARRRDFVVAYALWLVLVSGVLIGLQLWDATVEWMSIKRLDLEYHTPLEVWRDWHDGKLWGWGRAEATLSLTVLLATVAIAGWAWLHLILVWRVGSVWHAYRTTFRAVSSVGGLPSLVLATCGAAIVLARRSIYFSNLFGPDLEFKLLILAAGTLWVTVGWLNRAVGGLGSQPVQLDLPPRCEGCGYDLTHRPDDDRCPECGRPASASLTWGRLRRPSPWVQSPSPRTWLATTWTCLVHPTVFYRALALRGPGYSERHFAAWTYGLIAAGGFAWGWAAIGLMVLRAGPWPGAAAALLVLSAATLLGTLGCWFGHRLIASVVLTFWVARRAVPDGRWAAKVMTYESVFLWVFCAFWAAMLTSFALWEDWVGQVVFRRRTWLAFPVELWTTLLGTVALAGVWLWRYHIAWRAIRWSNF